MINDLIDITQLSVFESMMDYMNKIETIIEYAGYTDYADDLIAEMFDVYLEATDRRKKADEIDKYLADKNVVNAGAKNPSKARKARQVRNFLMTQDFDPKTGTIKSDYKDKNGKSPRINLKFDVDKDYSAITDDDVPKHIIGLTNATIKGKAANRALTMSHEKGHELFDRDGRAEKWSKGDKNDDANKNERGIKFINKAIDSGKDINNHDSGEYIVNRNGQDGYSPEEIEADLHGAKAARIRTKYAGSKRAVKRSGATRNVNDNEIERFFIYLQKSVEKPLTTGESIVKETSKMISVYKQCIELGSIIDEIRNTNPNEIDVNKYISIIKNHDKFVKMVDNSQKFYIARYEQLEDELKNLENEIKSYGNMPSSEATDAALQRLKKLFDDKSYMYHNYEKQEFVNTGYIYTCINRIYDYLKAIRNGGNIVTPKLPDSETLRKHIENIVKNLEDEKNKINQLRNQLSESKKTLRKWLNDNMNIKPSESAQMRHDFVKQYLHEYFIEFMTEYHSSIFNE